MGLGWLLTGYGAALVVLGMLAAMVRGPGSTSTTPILVLAYAQVVFIAVLVPSWLVAWRPQDDVRRGVVLFYRSCQLLLAGLAAELVASIWAGAEGWFEALILQAVLVSFTLTAAGVSVLVWAVVRKRAPAQLLATTILLAAAAAPLLANPVIRAVSSDARGHAVDVTSYISPVVVTSYAVGVDFYRGPRMYDWSVAGSYRFSVPHWPTACAAYLIVGGALITAFRRFLPAQASASDPVPPVS